MAGNEKGIGVNLGFGNVEQILAAIEGVDGVEAADYASPVCLHDVYVTVAATVDVETLIPTILAISGVDDAYEV